MSASLCPACAEPLPTTAINIEEGVALCPSCGQLSRLSQVVATSRPITEILEQPPAGCAIIESGTSTTIYATLRSIIGFVGLLFITLFWNGIVSVFVMVVVAAIIEKVAGPLPAWFPAPNNRNELSVGMIIFLCLFLTPFIAVGVTMFVSMILTAIGKVEVVLDGGDGIVRTGVGRLVYSKRFDQSRVQQVTIEESEYRSRRNATNRYLVIEADKKISFGSMLTPERREWMMAVLQVLLLQNRK